MKIASTLTLFILLVLTIAIFQVVQQRNARELAAATPSITATPFLATANTATPTSTVILTATATLTPTPTLSATATTLSETPTPTPPFTASPTQLPIVVEGMGNCTPITHYNPFMLPADHQNDIDWIATAIVDHLNSGGDPYRIVDTFRLLGRDAYLQYVDLEGDGTKELLLQVSTLPQEGRKSFLGVIRCKEQFILENWIAETDSPFDGIRIIAIQDLNQDGVKEVITTALHRSESVDAECDASATIYWTATQHIENLVSPFVPFYCSHEAAVTIEATDNHPIPTLFLHNPDYFTDMDEAARFEWEAQTGAYAFVGIEVAPEEPTVEIPTTLPPLPPPFTANPQAAAHCPPTRPIPEFWLVPGNGWRLDEKVLDFGDGAKGVPPQLLAYLNAGGDPDDLKELLVKRARIEEVRRVDLDSDGVNELLISVGDRGWGFVAGLGLFYCTSDGLYQFGGWLSESGYKHILTVEDFNHDGDKEVLFTNIPDVAGCYLERYLLGWDGTTLRQLFIEGGGHECGTSTTLTDIDGDGYDEIVIYGINDGMWWSWTRYATWVYKLRDVSDHQPERRSSRYDSLLESGLVYMLDSKVLDPPLDRVHILEDAMFALEANDILLAITLYEQAISDPTFSFNDGITTISAEIESGVYSDEWLESKIEWRDTLVEAEELTLAFAHLHLVMLHSVNRNPTQAAYWLEQMEQRFPQGTAASDLRLLAQMFMNEWEVEPDIVAVCSTLNTQKEIDYSDLSWDNDVTRRSYFGWSPICPFEE